MKILRDPYKWCKLTIKTSKHCIERFAEHFFQPWSLVILVLCVAIIHNQDILQDFLEHMDLNPPKGGGPRSALSALSGQSVRSSLALTLPSPTHLSGAGGFLVDLLMFVHLEVGAGSRWQWFILMFVVLCRCCSMIVFMLLICCMCDSYGSLWVCNAVIYKASSPTPIQWFCAIDSYTSWLGGGAEIPPTLFNHVTSTIWARCVFHLDRRIPHLERLSPNSPTDPKGLWSGAGKSWLNRKDVEFDSSINSIPWFWTVSCLIGTSFVGRSHTLTETCW